MSVSSGKAPSQQTSPKPLTMSDGPKPGDLVVAGRIDASSSPQLDARLQTLNQSGPVDLCLDLAQVTYISSSGLRVLLLAHRRQQLKGGRLLLCNVSERVLHILSLCGFDRVFHLVVGPAPSKGD